MSKLLSVSVRSSSFSCSDKAFSHRSLREEHIPPIRLTISQIHGELLLLGGLGVLLMASICHPIFLFFFHTLPLPLSPLSLTHVQSCVGLRIN